MVVSDSEGYRLTSQRRIVYTNPDFARALAADRPVPKDPNEFAEYMGKIDNGLYFIGWQLYVAEIHTRLVNPTYICEDEYTKTMTNTPTFTCMATDRLMWRAASSWAHQISNLYLTLQELHATPGLVIAPNQRDFLMMYREFFIP